MKEILRGRKLKNAIKPLLLQDSLYDVLSSIRNYPPKKIVNVLISFFCDKNILLKWRAVSAMGVVVSVMAETSMEDARVIMRRLMWMLNEESGGIGWGAPEAMGEIMAKCRKLAEEYNRILISYADEHGNYIEHAPLMKGVLWGIGRLSETWPDLAQAAAPHTRNFLFSHEPFNRGLAAIIIHSLNDPESNERLEQLKLDKAEITIYSDGSLNTCMVCDFARSTP